MKQLPILLLAILASLPTACGKPDETASPPLATTMPSAPTEADRREATTALKQDLESLTSVDSRAVVAAEDARNRDLESTLGGADAARQAECARLTTDLQRLESQRGTPEQAQLSTTDREALPAAIADVAQRLADHCG
jgi:hypothetical protein